MPGELARETFVTGMSVDDRADSRRPLAFQVADDRDLRVFRHAIEGLRMPPVVLPYSAGRPPVFTSTSSTKSKLSSLPWSPKPVPVTFKPSMTILFSAPVEP